MSYYYYFTEEEINQHTREHQRGTISEKRPHCNICYPTLIEPEYPPGFAVFWNWIATSYFAQSYNGYTILAYRHLEESITKGDPDVSKQILSSIGFRSRTISVAELSFYIRRFYIATNHFNYTPTLNQLIEARNLYTAPKPQQSQPQVPPPQPVQ